jgi:hypothetical protein
MKDPLIFRGRPITSDDPTLIQSLIKEHSKKGRKFISQELCRKWQWYQLNGNLKNMATREILLRLQSMGLIQLPPGRTNGNNS